LTIFHSSQRLKNNFQTIFRIANKHLKIPLFFSEKNLSQQKIFSPKNIFPIENILLQNRRGLTLHFFPCFWSLATSKQKPLATLAAVVTFTLVDAITYLGTFHVPSELIPYYLPNACYFGTNEIFNILASQFLKSSIQIFTFFFFFLLLFYLLQMACLSFRLLLLNHCRYIICIFLCIFLILVKHLIKVEGILWILLGLL